MPLEQTTDGAVPRSLPPPPQIMHRINPSPELQQQVADAIQACTKWQPEVVGTANVSPLSLQLSTEAQVCDVLDRWPAMHAAETALDFSIGVGLAIAAAAVWLAVRAVLREVLDTMPCSPIAKHFIARAAGGALCGIGVATFWVLLTMPRFVAVTFEQTADQALLSWSSTAPWAAAAFATMFVLSGIPSIWLRQALSVAGSRVTSPWSGRED